MKCFRKIVPFFTAAIIIAILASISCKTSSKTPTTATAATTTMGRDTSADAIVEKYWKLVELYGKPVAVDSSFAKEPHIIFKKEGSRFNGNGGCNSITGIYQVSEMNRITITQAITTQMACPAMGIESEFLRAIQEADNYNIVADMLILNKAKMAPLARFKTVYMK